MEGTFGAWHLALAFVLGAALAGLLAWGKVATLARRREELERAVARLEAELRAEREKAEWLLGAKDELTQAFAVLAGRQLEASSAALVQRTHELLARLDRQLAGQLGTHKSALEGLVGPLREHLAALEAQVRELEQKREGAYGGLAEQLRALAEQQRALQEATTTLGEALKNPGTRGRWGELQLKRVVELAGMAPHVDYSEQPTTARGRPDLIVHLPGGGTLPVDAKTPLAAYLAAVEAADEAVRKARLAEHARQLRARVRELAGKAYWEGLEGAPEFVVVFVPSEAALAAAFEADPGLLDDALAQRVLPAGPVTLLALLKAVAYGWRQQALGERARRIAEEGGVLIARFEAFAAALAEVGQGLEQGVAAYNRAVGRYQRRLAPAARRFRELLEAPEPEREPEPVDDALREPPAPGPEDA
ncbi:DNA recombination protein RmuC [Oceanithermus sp.]|uniref:DNA recombination protein RmuC n=1 Tax=Oceanithermus sp. TaxID=2268145 RepID=UPI0025E4EE6B|nr:DNA recombination protein RmuC [Oceanithermus sp.]